MGFLDVYLSLGEHKFVRMESDSEVDDRFAAVAGDSEEGSEEEEEEDEIEPPKKRKLESSRKRLGDSETLQEKKKKPGVIYLSRSLNCSCSLAPTANTFFLSFQKSSDELSQKIAKSQKKCIFHEMYLPCSLRSYFLYNFYQHCFFFSVPDGMNVTQTTAFFSEFGRLTIITSFVVDMYYKTVSIANDMKSLMLLLSLLLP